jgi:1-acyl-sn-glycerol-3-phosphate acyltransferase
MEIQGSKNLPSNGAVILAANHEENYDPFIMQLAISRPIFFMAKAELHKNAWVDSLLRRLGSFPVQRNGGDEWAMQHAVKILANHQALGIFPEGTRNRGRGLRVAKTGAARLALTAQCPIVPMALIGSHQLFKRLTRRTQVTVILGVPVIPSKDETALALTDRLMFSLAELLPRELRGVYAHHPAGFD